ncbi:MAG: hypothetical protein Q8M95_09330 [Candidatus Methanoperedens sp.]|nr:hypothetical protein [Candidatus Methanoperedens sp.]
MVTLYKKEFVSGAILVTLLLIWWASMHAEDKTRRYSGLTGK